MHLIQFKQSFDALQSCPFPPSCDIAEFTDWRSQLVEMDAFYAGLAVSAINGKGAAPFPFPSLASLEEDLKSMHERQIIPPAVYEDSERYLGLLKNIAEAIRSFQT